MNWFSSTHFLALFKQAVYKVLDGKKHGLAMFPLSLDGRGMG